MNEVITFLNNEIIFNKNSNVVVAVSYGPDSMALFDMLNKLSKEKKFNVICAHVNHNLREESKEEKKLLEKYCKDNKITFEYYEIQKDKKYTEAEYREIRYDFLDKIVSKYKAKYLFTAHHGDDLVETIMMRIVRGSSISGYSGIQLISKRKNYEIVRPLLYITKDEIMNYVSENFVPYAIDKTNTSEVYTRNRYRKNMLTFLKQEDKNVHLKFLKFSKTLDEYSKYVESISKQKYKENYLNKIDINIFKMEDKVIQKNIVSLILSNAYGNDISKLDDKSISIFLNTIYSKKSNVIVDFPLNYVLRKEYNICEFVKKSKNTDYKLKLEDNLVLPDGHTISIINETDSNSNYVTRLNSKDIKLPLYVRNRRNGDYIVLKGMNKHKKIKDIYIDEKISPRKREISPLLVDSNDTILWVPGIKKSIFDRKKNEEYDIILHYD